MGFFWAKYARRIFASVSTTSIPDLTPVSPTEATVDPPSRGSRLAADHPENGDLIPRGCTVDRRPVQGGIDPAMEKDVTIGEHRHLVLQALCRGSVRKCQGDMCAPCNAYIIAAPRSGIPEALPAIFPGCRVVKWQPVKKELRGKVKDAVEFVVDWFKKNADGLLRFNVVQKALGISAAGTFKNDVRSHPGF